MVSSSRSGESQSKKSNGGGFSAEVSRHKKQIQAARLESIKGKVVWNAAKLREHIDQLSRFMLEAAGGRPENNLSGRMENPICMMGSSEPWEKEWVCVQEENPLSQAVAFTGNTSGTKTVSPFIRFPSVEKIPPYTTWIFLNRNQRMIEDQSVVGRRQIYYDLHGGETLICSDSENDTAELEEEKHEFSSGEDEVLWKAFQEHGVSYQALYILAQILEATPSEIEQRYETLMRKKREENGKTLEASHELGGKYLIDKTLDSTLDSFDSLFCRRCLIFYCKLHGCSQGVIIPCDKPISVEFEENRIPCSEQCYLQLLSGREAEDECHIISDVSTKCELKNTDSKKELNPETSCQFKKSTSANGNTTVTLSERTCPDANMHLTISSEIIGKTPNRDSLSKLDASTSPETLASDLRRKVLMHVDTVIAETMSSSEAWIPSSGKKQKKLFSQGDSMVIEDLLCSKPPSESCRSCPDPEVAGFMKQHRESGCGGERADIRWSRIEKDLYLKGVEIFGKNSCLISRNLLSGMKTCTEVSNFMFNNTSAVSRRNILVDSNLEDNMTSDNDCMEHDISSRTRIWRRRGRTKKLKYTWKSAGYPSIRKRIGDGKQPAKQYMPCGCSYTCGKECRCMNNGTCCEKYCGCSKNCKNRFRGCHCAKSQCRSRQCPCYAASRECDPDVCKNCWVSCGDADGPLGEPPRRGDFYQCGNMNLLLRQHQGILLGRSNVAGWGTFLKKPVKKNDFLGEYTGEVISHKEADKRGKIYDRTNSSFLFDLNDQYVLDAYRKGDKMKFANHSYEPNCQAKVMLVAGDHRVGIYAKESIDAGEEMFYNYHYGPDQTPAWARKLGGSRRDYSSISSKRAKKVA